MIWSLKQVYHIKFKFQMKLSEANITLINSHDLIVNSLLWQLHISLQISDKNLVLLQDYHNNFYLILSILTTCFLHNVWLS